MPIAIAQYVPKVLHLDATKVRALDVNGGDAGFRGGYIAAFSIAGFLALCLVAGLARAMFLLRRARRSKS